MRLGQGMSGQHSTRVDAALGIEERVGFFGSEQARLFGCLHAPLKAAVAAVLLCPPIYADFTLNYRRHVMLGRFLASQGILVQRFHYRGTGNSFGDPDEVTYESLVEDSVMAGELLMESARRTSLSLLGVGWGGLVAASAAGSFPAASLVLWEPVLEAASYYRQAVKAKMVGHVVSPTGRPSSAGQLIAELENGGSVDILGYLVQHRLYASSKGRKLGEELGDFPHPVLLIDAAGKDGLRKEYAHWVSACKERGLRVDTATAGTPAAVWFHGQQFLEAADETAKAVGACVRSWLTSEAAA